MPLRLALAALVLAGPLAVSAQQPATAPAEGPYFVYLGSFTAKASAQRQAADHDGWVLRTDLYRDLSPGFYAAVLGPFAARPDADEALASVRLDLPDAFVRAAGPALLPGALGDPALLSAVLGDLTVRVSAAPDTANVCAPDEPYVTVVVGFEQSRAWADVPAAGFWLVERTGEVRPAVHCDGPPEPPPVPNEAPAPRDSAGTRPLPAPRTDGG